MAATSPVHALVADIIDRRAVHTVFQPLVHLQSLEAVGFEALARGPEQSRPPLDRKSTRLNSSH